MFTQPFGAHIDVATFPAEISLPTRQYQRVLFLTWSFLGDYSPIDKDGFSWVGMMNLLLQTSQIMRVSIPKAALLIGKKISKLCKKAGPTQHTCKGNPLPAFERTLTPSDKRRQTLWKIPLVPISSQWTSEKGSQGSRSRRIKQRGSNGTRKGVQRQGRGEECLRGRQQIGREK